MGSSGLREELRNAALLAIPASSYHLPVAQGERCLVDDCAKAAEGCPQLRRNILLTWTNCEKIKGIQVMKHMYSETFLVFYLSTQLLLILILHFVL